MFRQDPPPKRHRLLFGINDVRLREAGAQAVAGSLGLDRYAIPVHWQPGQRLTGNELGAIPRSQSVFAYLYGNAKDAPRTQQQRHAYANFARALVKQNPNIRELQVWNEPSVPLFWKQNQLAYMPLLANTYDRLHGTGVRVVAPGSHPGIPQQLGFVKAVRDYYHGSGRKRPLFDIYAEHPYWDWQKTDRVARAMGQAWRGLPQRSPLRGHLPIWWTETGRESDSGGAAPPGYGSPYTGRGQPWRLSGTPQQQAQRIRQVAAAAQRDPYVGALFNFLLYDESNLAGWQTGLLDPTGVRKPAYTALQSAILQARKRGF